MDVWPPSSAQGSWPGQSSSLFLKFESGCYPSTPLRERRRPHAEGKIRPAALWLPLQWPQLAVGVHSSPPERDRPAQLAWLGAAVRLLVRESISSGTSARSRL